SYHAAGHVKQGASAVPRLDRSRHLKVAGIIPRSSQGRNMSQRTITAGGQEARVGKAKAGYRVANPWARAEGGRRKIVHIRMQQGQIIRRVLTGYRCWKRPPVWIPHLNVFCASTHDVIVRYHAIWRDEETSSG